MPLALSHSTLQDFTSAPGQHARRGSSVGLRASRPRVNTDASVPASPSAEYRRAATPSALTIVNDAKDFLHDCGHPSRLPVSPAWNRRPSAPLLDDSRSPFEGPEAVLPPRLAPFAKSLPSLDTETPSSSSAPASRERSTSQRAGRHSAGTASPPLTDTSRRRTRKKFSLCNSYQSLSSSPPKKRMPPRVPLAQQLREDCDDPILSRLAAQVPATLRQEAQQAVATLQTAECSEAAVRNIRSEPLTQTSAQPPALAQHQPVISRGSAKERALSSSKAANPDGGSRKPPNLMVDTDTPSRGSSAGHAAVVTPIAGGDKQPFAGDAGQMYRLSPAATATRAAAAGRFGCPNDDDDVTIMPDSAPVLSDEEMQEEVDNFDDGGGEAADAADVDVEAVDGEAALGKADAVEALAEQDESHANTADLFGLPASLEVRHDQDYWDQSTASNASHLFDSVDGRDIRNRSRPPVVPEGACDEGAKSARESLELLPQGGVQGTVFCWSRGELIGRGSLGSVWQAMDQRTGRMMAVKEVLLQSGEEDDRFRASLQNEVDLYKDLRHPNIVSYLGNDLIGGRLCIYLEYMPGGSLSQLLSQFGALDEPLAAMYMRNLLEGLNYLHTRDPCVLHRDIKGANILVGMHSTVKLTDFGCSKRTSGTGTAAHTLRGSVPWMAPEVMRGVSYGRRADIWSLGCVLIEMCTGDKPWGHFDNCLAAMVKIAMSDETPKVPAHLSEQGRDFVTRCTRRTPEERPDASQLLAHGFVEGVMDISDLDSFGD